MLKTPVVADMKPRVTPPPAGKQAGAWQEFDAGFSVRLRASGTYEVRVAGQRNQTRIAGYPVRTEAAAMRLGAKMLAQKAKGVDPSAETLGAYLQWWLDNVVVNRSVGTQKRYACTLRSRGFLPGGRTDAIASVRLRDLRNSDFQELWTRWRKLGLSHAGIKTDYAVIRAALSDAVPGKLESNPAQHVTIGSGPRRASSELSSAQVNSLVAACVQNDNTADDVIVVLAYTGARVNELLSAEERYFTVEQNGLGRLLVFDSKTASGVRPLILPPPAVAAVQRVLTRKETRSLRGQRKLFAVSYRAVKAHFDKRCADLNLPYTRPHDLRHHWGSTAKRAGVPLKDISTGLGHADTSITSNLYQHSDDPSLVAAAVAVYSSILGVAGDSDPCPHCGGTGRIAKRTG